jgi:hypothetical protein
LEKSHSGRIEKKPVDYLDRRLGLLSTPMDSSGVRVGFRWPPVRPAEENGKVIVPKMSMRIRRVKKESTLLLFPSFEKIEKPVRYSMTTTA